MMDLTKFGLSEEQLANVTAAYEEDVAGLKNTVDSLKGEKLKVQQLAEDASSALADKQKALELAEEEKLKIEGNQDNLKAFYEKQAAAQAAKDKQTNAQLKAVITERDTNEAKAVVLSKVNPDFKDMAEALLDKKLTVSYDEDGGLVKEFKTDDGVVSSEADFLSWASEKSETWQRVLLAANASGGNTQQTKFNGASKPYGEMSLEERAKHNSKVN